MDSGIGTTLGRYRLVERIGRGGMAHVYVAEEVGTATRVAIKVLTSLVAENDQFVQRFRQEARVVARLKHPNIIPVVDYGEVDGKAFLVMPYLPCGSLSDRLAQGSIPPQDGGKIIGQVSAALDFAHGHGVIHRDVKPSNILLDEEGHAWLSDFGLAYLHDASLSLTGSAMLGTPAYVSPEQARGEKARPRSDQYSLGIVLFEMVTGELPFEAETPMGVLVKHMQTPIPLPRSIRSAVPIHVERVILKATAKDPDDRFGSVAEMNEAFQAALAHALNPSLNPPPALIPVPPSNPTVPLPAGGYVRIGRRRLRPWQLGLAATSLALFVCLPSAYAGMYLLPASTGGASRPQLTAQAATIQALSTQLVANQAGGLSADELQVAVIQTLTAMRGGDGSGDSLALAQPGGLLPGVFPALFAGGSPTPTRQATNQARNTPIGTRGAPAATPTGAATSGSGGAVAATPTSGLLPTVTQPAPSTATQPPPTQPAPTQPPPTSPPAPTDPPPPPTDPPPAPTDPPKDCDPRKPPGHPHACPPDS